jgi:hypothetical protein
LIVRDVTYSKILWNAGVLNLKAFNLNNDQIEVKVQFFAPDHQYNTIQITYKELRNPIMMKVKRMNGISKLFIILDSIVNYLV